MCERWRCCSRCAPSQRDADGDERGRGDLLQEWSAHGVARVLLRARSSPGTARHHHFNKSARPKNHGGSARCWLLSAWSMLAATLQGMVTMTELLTTTHADRPKRSNVPSATARRVYWSARSALATHLGCVRVSTSTSWSTQGVIERRADGRFDQDQCRAEVHHASARGASAVATRGG